MSLLVDSNVLLYAVNTASPRHEAARDFVREQAAGAGFCVTWSILYEWLRVVTHPAVFPRPLDPARARQYIRRLVGEPRVEVLLETPRHLEVLEEVLADAPPLRGNRYHDAHIAAVMREHGVGTIATCDGHFRLFQFLKVIDPTS